MEVSEAKRLKALEDENARLKKLLAEQMLDAAALRELLAKNVWSAPSVQGVATSQKTVPVAQMYPASREWTAVAARP